MTTCAESAAEVRAALKSRGITSRQVSVRADTYSMGSALRIEIKDPRVPLARVKAAAEKHQHIRRDGWGEILSGGNRYVDITYTSEARQALSDQWIAAVEAAAAKPQSGRLSLWDPDSHIQEFYGARALAAHVGLLMVEKGPIAS